ELLNENTVVAQIVTVREDVRRIVGQAHHPEPLLLVEVTERPLPQVLTQMRAFAPAPQVPMMNTKLSSLYASFRRLTRVSTFARSTFLSSALKSRRYCSRPAGTVCICPSAIDLFAARKRSVLGNCRGIFPPQE